MNIIRLLDTACATYPNQTALIHGEERVSYRELAVRSQAVGAFFQAHGVMPGQRALLLMPLGIDFYVVLLGLARIGVTVMLIDPAVGKRQINHCCQLAQPDLFVGSPKAHLLRLTTSAIRQIPRHFALGGWAPSSQAVRYEQVTTPCHDAHTSPDDPALITFTSGSTGQPKAICRTHGFLYQQHQVLCDTIPAHAGEVELNTLPVFILSSLARGVTVLIGPGGSGADGDPAAVIATIASQRVNRILAAPAFCQQLADQLTATGQTLPTITHLYTGGGPVFPNLLTKLAATLPNARLVSVYGSTEAEPIAQVAAASYTPNDWQAMRRGQGLLAGHPVSSIQLAIMPDTVGTGLGDFSAAAFAAYCLPTGAVGEIVVSGAHVQQRYLGGDDGVTKFTVGGTIWHRTGDAGYLDAEGRLWLLGRCCARIVRSGVISYPFGVEAAALCEAGVERAAYLEVNGKGVLAIQSARAQWPQLRQRLAQALPNVDQLQWLATIPVDSRHRSKVLYGETRQLVGG